jgi:hypothetical protein
MDGVPEVDALVVRRIIGLVQRIRAVKHHVAHARQHAHPVEDRAEGQARPFRDGAPTLHAVVARDLGAGGQSAPIREREARWTLDEPAHLKLRM